MPHRENTVLDHLEELVIIMDLQQRIIWANQRALEYFDTTLDRLQGEYCHHIWDQTDFCPDCELLRNGGAVSEKRFITQKADGHRWSVRFVPLMNEDNEVEGTIEIALDISEVSELSSGREEEGEMFQTLVESVEAILWSYHVSEDRWEYVSPQTRSIVGYEPEEWKGLQFWKDALHPDDTAWAVEYCLGCAQRGEDHVFEYRFQKKDGTYIWLKDKVNVEMLDGSPIRLRGVMVDVTDMKKQEEELLYLSFHDPLTGLYNRRFFEEELIRLDSERQFPISIALADLNGLKIVNDVFGHAQGDDLLVRTAKLLKENFRKEDIVARWGGDEFVILLPHTSDDRTGAICQRISQITHATRGEENPISISFGWATKESAEQDIQDVLKQAEEWMYKNKLTESRSTRSALLRGMLQSLEAKSHETREHLLRMQELALKLGRKLKLTPSEMNRLTLLVSLHDIGKIGISEAILKKPDPLTDEEWQSIKRHPEMGFRIAAATHEFSGVAEEIMHHHERWDGYGYPKGLKGEAIPKLSRIAAIVDSYDAMTNDRPYRGRKKHSEALVEIEKNAGTQFDPEIANAFIELMDLHHQK